MNNHRQKHVVVRTKYGGYDIQKTVTGMIRITHVNNRKKEVFVLTKKETEVLIVALIKFLDE